MNEDEKEFEGIADEMSIGSMATIVTSNFGSLTKAITVISYITGLNTLMILYLLYKILL